MPPIIGNRAKVLSGSGSLIGGVSGISTTRRNEPKILDIYPASRAYSLMQLTNEYSGDYIVVRRSSDDEEDSFGVVGGMLDTASIESFLGGSDGYIAQWFDVTGNGDNVTQIVTSGQPQIAASGTVLTKNGLPTINFSGSTWLDLVGTPIINTSGVYTVFSIDTPTQDSVMVFSGNSTDLHYWSKGMSTTNRYGSRVRNDSGGVNVIDRGDTLTDTTSLHQLSLLFDIGATTPTSSVSLDQVASTQTRRTRTSNIDYTISLGAQGGGLSNFLGNISEVIVFEEDTASFRTAIEDSQILRYSI